MIPIKQACENIAGLMSVPNTFKYGTPQELDTLGDDVIVWPAIFMFNLMGTKLEFGRSLGLSQKPQLNILFINKTDFGEFANESEHIREAMQSLCEEYMNRLANYRPDNVSPYFDIKPGTYGNITFVYDEFDVNVTGVRLELSPNLHYKNSACI